MTQDIKYRLNYHPDPRVSDQGDRKVFIRLQNIKSHLDFSDKIVLDLGCSGGFFAFNLSKIAKQVIAIDGDKEIIARNKAIQKEMGIKNISFINAIITEDLIDNLKEQIDITLFLSVYHHLLTMSDAYGWNKDHNYLTAENVIKAIHRKTRHFVFEMGYPDEGYEWCERMPETKESWDSWIANNIFKLNGEHIYEDIRLIEPKENQKILKKSLTESLAKNYVRDKRWKTYLKSFFKYDSRDKRKIFIGINNLNRQ